jgi:hypothetical protein
MVGRVIKNIQNLVLEGRHGAYYPYWLMKWHNPKKRIIQKRVYMGNWESSKEWKVLCPREIEKDM